MSVHDRVSAMIQEHFLRGKEISLGDGDSFLEEGVVDSLGMMELVSLIQSEFSVSIDDEELMPGNLDSIEAITGFLKGKGVAD